MQKQNIRCRHWKNQAKIAVFCLILILCLEILSQLSLILNRDPDLMENADPWCIMEEPEHTIDMIAIGNSNVRSGIIPMQLWKDYGLTSYSWGEGAVRVYDVKQHLIKIFQKHSPGLVVLEASCFFRDTTLADNLDSIVRARLSKWIPLVTYHNNLRKLSELNVSRLTESAHSVTKGYRLSYEVKASKKGRSYMKDAPEKKKDTSDEKEMDPLVEQEILDIKKLCEENGAKLLIAAVPSTSDWGYQRHQTVKNFCEEQELDFFDMNNTDALTSMKFNWKKNSRDGGIHLNYQGAKKATEYLGEYLSEHYELPDHRADSAYQSWQKDCRYFYENIGKKE